MFQTFTVYPKMWSIYPHRVQHIDRNWCYVQDLIVDMKEEVTIREAQMILGKAEKAPRKKPIKYEPCVNVGHKAGILPDYWSWGA